MKVKEYRFHIPIYHIFWELQFAKLPECITVSKLPGLQDPVSGSAMAAPFIRSVVRAIASSTETPERPPEIHEGLPNLAESNDHNDVGVMFIVMANAHSYLECITLGLCVR
jgi:hypothetical protein